MGSSAQRSSTDSSQSTNSSGTRTATATPEERELQALELDRRKAIQPFALQADRQGFETFGIPLSGGELPGGEFNLLGRGISEEAQDAITEKALKAADVGFAGSGLLDSGARSSIRADIVKDIGVTSELERIGQLQNLLNIAIGAPAQIQAPALNESALLGQRLQGLRPITTIGASQSRGKSTTSSFGFKTGT